MGKFALTFFTFYFSDRPASQTQFWHNNLSIILNLYYA